MRLVRILCFVTVGLSELTVSACSANHYAVYRSNLVATRAPTMTLVDAKQRVIMTAPTPPPTSGSDSRESQIRICAEASPDVFAVLAQAASGSGSFGRGADPSAIQAAASAAYSMSEQGSSIARTQTINVLREVMYRTCERYLSGGLTALELPVQAVRDERLIVAALAIEQLTAAATPRPLSIGASGSASGGSNGAEVVARLDDAWKALQIANTTLAQRKAELQKLEDVAPSCTTIKNKTTLDASETAKAPECTKARDAVAAAQKTSDDQAAHYALLKTASAGPSLASAATSLQAPVDTAASTSGQPLSQVAATVQEIVRMNYQQDEFLLLCLKVLSPTVPNPNLGPLRATCASYVQAGISKDAARISSEAAALNGIIGARDLAFSNFWAKIAQAPGSTVPDKTKLERIVDNYLSASVGADAFKAQLAALRAATSREVAKQYFFLLSPNVQLELLQR